MIGPTTMEIEIATIGGYEEVGRQMTAVRAGDDIVIFDMGLNLSKVLIHDNIRTEGMHSLDLIDMGAIPDDRVMSDLEGRRQNNRPHPRPPRPHRCDQQARTPVRRTHRRDAVHARTRQRRTRRGREVQHRERTRQNGRRRNDVDRRLRGRRTRVRQRHTLDRPGNQPRPPHARRRSRLRARQTDGPHARHRRPDRHGALPRDRPRG